MQKTASQSEVRKYKNRRLVHETDSNFVVLADEEITKRMNHPKPVRKIRHSSATVVELPYTRSLNLLAIRLASWNLVGSTIIDKIQNIPSLHISLILSLLLPPVSCLFICRENDIQGSLPCLYTIHNENSVLIMEVKSKCI